MPNAPELARREDAEQIRQLLVERAKFSRDLGIDMWRTPRTLIEILEDIERGELFVIHDNGEVLASVQLTLNKDPYWLEENPSAMYLHKLISRRKGLGHELLKWAELHVATRGFTTLRLDTDNRNEKLKAYYLAHGYESRGVQPYAPYNMDFALFEKTLRD